MAPESAAIYLRISSDPDGLRLGVTRQQQDCLALAKRLGWLVGEVYEDNDISASKSLVRPAYNRMIADCESGLRDGIIVYNVDRLTRRLAELAHFLDWRERHKLAFATTEGDDTTNASGRMIVEIKGVMAQQESRRISERVTRSHLQLAQLGKDSGGGTKPYGYEHDRKTIRPDEAAIIRQIVKRVLDTESLTSIARDLSEQGIPTPGASNRWQRGIMKRMLLRPRLAGLRFYRGTVLLDNNGQPVRGQWPAIISVDEHEQLKDILTEPGRNNHAGRIDRKYLLSGILRCKCGVKMYGVTKRGLATYVCPSLTGCGSTHRRADHIDKHITELVLRFLERQELPVKPEKPDDTLDRVVEQAELDLAGLINEWNEGRMSNQVFYTAQAKKEASLIALKRQRVTQRHRAVLRAPVGKGVRPAWAEANISQRRAIISEVLLAIQVLPKATTAPKTFDPAYYVPVWREATESA